MKNYYHLTKKELSFISSEQEPVISSYNGKRLTTPVVVVFSRDKRLLSVYSLKWFKHRVKDGTLLPNVFSYHIRVMF